MLVAVIVPGAGDPTRPTVGAVWSTVLETLELAVLEFPAASFTAPATTWRTTVPSARGVVWLTLKA
jgi:hypothetical protein